MMKFFDNATDFDAAVFELAGMGSYCPDVERVIYNLGKKCFPKLDEKGKRIRKTGPDGKPIKQLPKDSGKQLRDKDMFEMTEPKDILATVVYFSDGTKVSVTNSEADGLKLVEHTLSDGKTTTVASPESKELGLIYAVLKRLTAVFNDDGSIKSAPLGRILRDIVAESYDTQIEAAELSIARAKSKAEHKAKLNTAKPKQTYSIRDTLERINTVLDRIEVVPKDDEKPALPETDETIDVPVNG